MSERCFFTREKKVMSNQNRARCFFMCENTDTSNQKPQRCASFAPKFQPFIGAGSLHRPRLTSCFTDIQREKFFSKSFSRKKVKNISEIGVGIQSSCVCLSMKDSGRGKTERDVILSSAFYRSYFVFYLV